MNDLLFEFKLFQTPIVATPKIEQKIVVNGIPTVDVKNEVAQKVLDIDPIKTESQKSKVEQSSSEEVKPKEGDDSFIVTPDYIQQSMK